jgi:hypothetical protein
MYQIIITTTDEHIIIPIKDEEAIKILDEIDYSKLTKTEFYDEKYTANDIKNLCRVTIERDFKHDN